MTNYITGVQGQIKAAAKAIDQQMGLPDGDGTQTWDIPTQAVNNPLLWFITEPPTQGYKNRKINVTKAQMMADAGKLAGLTILPRDEAWFPPSKFPV